MTPLLLFLLIIHGSITDLAGEAMVDRQTQGLLLQTHEGRRAFITSRNFAIGPPQLAAPGVGSPEGPAAEGHPKALPDLEAPGGRGIFGSLAHVCASPGASGALGSGALLDSAVSSGTPPGKTDGLARL